MATLPCLKEPGIRVRINKRHDTVNMTQMNGENLNKLRNRKTSEVGRVVKSWNVQLTKQLKKNVGLWYKDQATAIANCSKFQRKVYGNLNHYHAAMRKIKREEHAKHQENVRQTLDKLRIKRIARKVVEKFRENVHKKKAQRIARRRSKRGTVARMKPIKEDGGESKEGLETEISSENLSPVSENISPKDIKPGSAFYLETGVNAVGQLTVENVAKLEKLHEEAKRKSIVEDDKSSREQVYRSKYLEVSKDAGPKTKTRESVKFSVGEQKNIDDNLEKPGDLPPLKLARRSQIKAPPKAALIANLQTWQTDQALTSITRANDPQKFISNFETIPEKQQTDNSETRKISQDSETRKISQDSDTSARIPKVSFSETVKSSDRYTDQTFRLSSGGSSVIRKMRADILNLERDGLLEISQHRKKQSVLNREKKKEGEIYRQRVLNEETPVFYTRNVFGDIVVSESKPKKTVFENRAGWWRYQQEKLKTMEKGKKEKQKEQLGVFYKKLSDKGKELKQTKPKTPPAVFDEEKPMKPLRRPSLSISALLNRPLLGKDNADEEDILKNCSYIREYEPEYEGNPLLREKVKQRKRSSWQLPVTAMDKNALARMYENALLFSELN